MNSKKLVTARVLGKFDANGRQEKRRNLQRSPYLSYGGYPRLWSGQSIACCFAYHRSTQATIHIYSTLVSTSVRHHKQELSINLSPSSSSI